MYDNHELKPYRKYTLPNGDTLTIYQDGFGYKFGIITNKNDETVAMCRMN